MRDVQRASAKIAGVVCELCEACCARRAVRGVLCEAPGAATGPPDHACMMVTGWGSGAQPRRFQRGAGRSPAAKIGVFKGDFMIF